MKNTVNTQTSQISQENIIKAEQCYKQGKNYYYKQAKVKEALEYFNQAIEFNSNYAQAYAEKGNVLRFLWQNPEALMYIDLAITLEPNYTIARYIRVRALIADNKLEEAQDYYKSITNLTNNEVNTETYFHQGSALFTLGKPEEAIECFDKAIKLNLNYATAYLNKGNALFALGKPEDAIECFDKAIELNPDNADVHYNKGNALSVLGRYEEAIECYDKTITLNPDDANAYYTRGTLPNLNKYLESIVCFDEAIEFKPKFALVYFNKGDALDILGKYEEAIKYYDKAIEISPNKANIYNNKGTSLNSLGKYEEAIEYYDKAIERKPNFVEAYNNKGTILDKLGKYEKATKYYDKAIELNPDNADVHYNKGNTLDRLGKYEEAIECYDKAIKLNPKLAFAYNGKGNVLHKSYKYEEAIECFDKAIGLNPKYASAYNGKGNILISSYKYKEAIERFDKAIELNPEFTFAYFNKGTALYNLGKYEKAIKCFDKAIELNPSEPLFYCGIGQVLNTLGKEQEALIYFNKAYELNKKSNLSNNSSKDNINYINGVLLKDREELLKKLAQLQKTNVKAKEVIDKLERDSPEVEKTIEQVQHNNEVIGNAVEVLRAAKSRSNLTKSTEDIKANIKTLQESHSQTQSLIINMHKFLERHHEVMVQGQTEIKVGLNEVKQLQKDQAKIHSEAMEKSFNELQILIDIHKTNATAISNISSKVPLLAKQKDVEAITQEVSKLVNEERITKGRLIALEEVVNSLIERQNKTDARLEKFELFQKATEEMKAKVDADGRLTQKDKEILEARINAIAEKTQSLAKQEDVETVTQEMFKLLSEAKITKGRLIDLEDDIDSLIEKTESLTVNLVSSITCDNPLLNHLTLFKAAEQYYGTSKALDLSLSLPKEFIDEAIHNNDSELLLAGIMSLNLN